MPPAAGEIGQQVVDLANAALPSSVLSLQRIRESGFVASGRIVLAGFHRAGLEVHSRLPAAGHGCLAKKKRI